VVQVGVGKKWSIASLGDATGVRGDPGPQICALLRNWTSDGRTLHLTLVVNNDSRVVFKVEKLAVFSSECFSLSDHHCRHNFLAELWLALLDCGQHHVTTGSGGQTVQATADASNCDDVQVLGTCVVSAVDDGSDWETQGNAELGSCGTSTSSLRHFGRREKEREASESG